MIINLKVDYKDRFLVKKLGAKWNPSKKLWTYDISHIIPIGLLPFIEDIEALVEQARKDVCKKHSDDEKDKFALLDNAKHFLFSAHHLIATQTLEYVLNLSHNLLASETSLAIAIKKSLLPEEELLPKIKESITHLAINEFAKDAINLEFSCFIKNAINFMQKDVAFNEVKKLIWVEDKNIDTFIKEVNKGNLSDKTYISEQARKCALKLCSDIIGYLDDQKRDELIKRYDFLFVADVSEINIERFINNGNKTNLLGHRISLSEGRKTIDVNNTNVIHRNGNLAIKLFELDSVRAFSRKLIKALNQFFNKLCNDFMEPGVRTVNVESGMWIATNNLNTVAHGFTQRGEWFVSSINDIDIQQNTPAAKKLVSMVVKCYSS